MQPGIDSRVDGSRIGVEFGEKAQKEENPPTGRRKKQAGFWEKAKIEENPPTPRREKQAGFLEKAKIEENPPTPRSDMYPEFWTHIYELG